MLLGIAMSDNTLNQFVNYIERRLLRDKNKATIRRLVSDGFKHRDSAGGLYPQPDGGCDIN